jgi:integrase
MPKLTRTLLRQLQPRAQAYITFDTEVRTFGVRVYPSGQQSYVLSYRAVPGRQGVKKTYVLGSAAVFTPDQARELARQWLAQIRLGVDPAGQKAAQRTAPTMADLAQRYLTEHAETKKKPGSLRMDRTNLRLHVLPALGSRLVQDLRRDDVSRLHHAMRGTPGAANRVLSLLRMMLTMAERWGWRPLHSNPVAHIEHYPERQMERYVTPEELARLGAVLQEAERTQTENPSVLACIRLVLFTGARVGEVLELRWSEIDWTRGLAFLPDSKTGRKPLRLPAPARAVLQGLVPLDGNPYCLPGRVPGQQWRGIRKPWYRLRAQAGLSDVRIHDLRHTYASRAGELGFSLPMIGALLGHQDAKTTQRYLHLVHDPVQAAAEAVGEALARALGG